MTTADDTTTPGEELFWELAARHLARPDVTRSTMMGFPCLRVAGEYFASTHRTTGDLIVKLPAPRVDELIAGGRAEPFAPSGRRFREWAAVPNPDAGEWAALLDEALAFVAGGPRKGSRSTARSATRAAASRSRRGRR